MEFAIACRIQASIAKRSLASAGVVVEGSGMPESLRCLSCCFLVTGDGDVCVGADRDKVHCWGSHSVSMAYFVRWIGAHRRRPETSGKEGRATQTVETRQATHDQSLEEAQGWPMSMIREYVGELNRRIRLRICRRRSRNRRPTRQVVGDVKGLSLVSQEESDGWRVGPEDVEKEGCIQRGRRNGKRLQCRGAACRILSNICDDA